MADLVASIDDYAEEYLRQQSNIHKGMDFLHGLFKRPPSLFSGLMPERTITMLSAEPASCKTMLTLSMALALDTATPLLGSFPPRERKRVFYLGQDAPSWDYAEQLRKLARGMSLSERQIEDLEVDFLLNEGGDFTDKRFLAELQAWHEEVGYQVVIFDTLASFHSLDENDNRQMGALMAILKRLRDQFNCTVIFTHHISKPHGDQPMSANYRARGATTISGSIDFHLSLERVSHERIRMSLAKGRGSERLSQNAGFTLIEGTNSDGEWARLESASWASGATAPSVTSSATSSVPSTPSSSSPPSSVTGNPILGSTPPKPSSSLASSTSEAATTKSSATSRRWTGPLNSSNRDGTRPSSPPSPTA